MRFTKTSLAILAVAGALALSPSTRAQTNTPPAGGRQAGRGRGAEQQLAQLSEQLKLTDDQKAKVKAVLEDERKKAQELRSDTSTSQQDMRTKRQAILQDTGKKMKEILTADQFKKYEEWRQQQRGRGGANGAPAGARPNRNRNAGTGTNGGAAGGQ